ncbi:DNA-binding transcriptional activator MhpR [Klebsiella pneumoniae]|uniref:DNA-binding transcriptional activator MhpR n=1 Tax=Klebsiella pneumoniae TaxID=573 RepID=A0A2X3CI60_KLEPN|nr:DNA-binding transcriptional activator MhpR [Klebsiella pneumoniae]
MRDDGSAAYKTVRGLSRGLLLLKLLNKFDGGATPGLLAEFSGLHRTTVRRLLETLQEEGFVRRSRSDDSFRLTINVRQLSDGFVTNIGFLPSPRRCSASCCARCSGQRTSPPSTSTPWWCARLPTASADCRFTARWSDGGCRCCSPPPD